MNVRLSQMDKVIWGTVIVGVGTVNQTKIVNFNLWKGGKQMELVSLGDHNCWFKHIEREISNEPANTDKNQ